MSNPRLHLICNAHIDPVWLWEWEEGVAAAVSTFRTAAELCEENEAFVFNHNEALLYEWVEEHEPELFVRIQRLVRAGRWHIMGGWFLQPDCNMPSGESFVRQILYGRRYFAEKFGARPTTAMNVDPFGHSRGLVQILRKSGYDSYLFCRPGPRDHGFNLEADNFVWVGFDGSEVIARRDPMMYNSPLGCAVDKIARCLVEYPRANPGMLLWGVGDHGGGPSRRDISAINAFRADRHDVDIVHSTPESFFSELRGRPDLLPRRERDINPWAVGCYTSQIRIKQAHRQLENELYATEKMAAHAALVGLMEYPASELQQAERDLLFSEFHDILPGSSIQPVEEMSLRLLNHGLEKLSRIKTRAFFRLAAGQRPARSGQIPILVYNPHPFPIEAVVECELQLEDQNWSGTFVNVTATRGGRRLPTQVEKEVSDLALDWRKRVVFTATLTPSSMNRFDCVLNTLSLRPIHNLRARRGQLQVSTRRLSVAIDTRTGLLSHYRIDGRDFLKAGAFAPVVFSDNADSWGMRVTGFRDIAGRFELMSPKEGARYSGVAERTLPSVRVIEDGPVRTVIEAVFSYQSSRLCLHYRIPKHGTAVEVRVRVQWAEKDRMLKLFVPTSLRHAKFVGQVAYGVQDLPSDGNEAVAHKWVAALSGQENGCVTCINDGTYGSSFKDGTIELSLLRSPAYAGHPIQRGLMQNTPADAPDRERDFPIIPQDRFTPRMEQGERLYRFWVDAGSVVSRLTKIDREAIIVNERPVAISYFPAGLGELAGCGVRLADRVVQMPACKLSTDGTALIVRLFEPTGKSRRTVVIVPKLSLRIPVELRQFELKTLRIDLRSREIHETNLLEESL